MCDSEWSATRLLSVTGVAWFLRKSQNTVSCTAAIESRDSALPRLCCEREKSSPLRLISWRPACEGLLLGSLRLHLLLLCVPCFSRQGLLIQISCLGPLAQKGKGRGQSSNSPTSSRDTLQVHLLSRYPQRSSLWSQCSGTLSQGCLPSLWLSQKPQLREKGAGRNLHKQLA